MMCWVTLHVQPTVESEVQLHVVATLEGEKSGYIYGMETKRSKKCMGTTYNDDGRIING